MFELHVLPLIGTVKLADANDRHIRQVLKRLADAGKIRTAIQLHVYLGMMFGWARLRKPWRSLVEIGRAHV